MADKDLLIAMGKRIYSRRNSLKLTQEKLAEKIGVSTQMISNLETGKKAIRPENLLKICDALNISADYILTGNSSNNTIDSITSKLGALTSQELEMVNEMIEYMNSKK